MGNSGNYIFNREGEKKMEQETIDSIEEQIDVWIYDKLDPDIPRNKYMYHCNLAYIDIMIDQKMMFTPYERHFLFSLNYNIHIAYKKLKEEDTFDYTFDYRLYPKAFYMILLGMHYSMLCDIFPMLHSGKAVMDIDGKDIYFNIEELPKRHYKFISDFSMRKYLSYTLQIANGKMEQQNIEDEDIAMKLSDLYMHFWSENMQYDDYEPYTRMDWSGVSFFFILAAMRRFNKLYKKDFDIVSLDSQKMMILMSPTGVSKIRNFVPSKDEELYQQALEDHIYKPRGKGVYPKANIADAPLIKTKDGYIFANSLVILFNESLDTQFLNYLRRCDNKRYLRIKDRIKEREIPLIQEMVKYKFSNVKSVCNFYVRIPTHKKNKRECDLLLVDDNGIAVYLEMKHFYIPHSYCEEKVLDRELTQALEKIPDQLEAISEDWDKIKAKYNLACDLKKIYGIIVSHRYTGVDVEIKPETPIVSSSDLFESIAEAKSLEDIYFGCREIDELYPKIEFIEKELLVNFAGYRFHLYEECLNPLCEILVTATYKKQVEKNIEYTTPTSYKSIEDLAHAYIDQMQETN